MEIVERKETKTRTKSKPAPNADCQTSVCEKASLKMANAAKTMFTKRKKIVIVATMVALLCVTVYFNFTLNNGNPIQTSAVETNMFATFRNNRADERARDIMVYENLVATSANAQTVATAEARLLEIRANVAFETAAESMILTEGFEDVLVNRTSGFVNVLIRRAENIDRTQAIKIMSILQTIQPGLDIDSVHISVMR